MELLTPPSSVIVTEAMELVNAVSANLTSCPTSSISLGLEGEGY